MVQQLLKQTQHVQAQFILGEKLHLSSEPLMYGNRGFTRLSITKTLLTDLILISPDYATIRRYN
jgi:hypothetical protein